MNDPASPRSRFWQPLGRWSPTLLGLAVVLFVLFHLWGSVATLRNAKESNQCEKNLMHVYDDLREYIQDHGDLPRDANGDVSLAIIKSSRSCQGEDLGAGYFVSPIVSPTHMTPQYEPTRVVLCDKPGNHVMHLANGLVLRRSGVVQEQALLLFTDGTVFRWSGHAPHYAEWAEDFAVGEGEPYPPGVAERLIANPHNRSFRQRCLSAPSALRTGVGGAK